MKSKANNANFAQIFSIRARCRDFQLTFRLLQTASAGLPTVDREVFRENLSIVYDHVHLPGSRQPGDIGAFDLQAGPERCGPHSRESVDGRDVAEGAGISSAFRILPSPLHGMHLGIPPYKQPGSGLLIVHGERGCPI